MKQAGKQISGEAIPLENKAKNQRQWVEIQNFLFPVSIPQRAVWEKLEDIVKVLKIACHQENCVHMFFPDGGGADLEDIRTSSESGCIELIWGLGSLYDIIKPKRLIFESFGDDSEWNYFRLELNELEPTIDHKDKSKDHEEVSEMSPGQYDPRSAEEIEENDEISGSVREVTRWFHGSIVIFWKFSIYNREPSTYDGRHNTMNTDKFRDYIQRNAELAYTS